MQQELTLWPRLLSVRLAAQYLSVGSSTIRDWVKSGLIQPIELPGSTLRRNGAIVARPTSRAIHKILITRETLDDFIDARKPAVHPSAEDQP